MKISIITVTYNSASTIKDTLDSVNSQTYKDIEHIIIDGASSDNTLELVRKYGKRVTTIISEKDKGIYDAMNKGIKAATGEIIGILNSDDFLLEKNIIEKIAKTFEENPDIDAVYSNLYYVKQNSPATKIRFWKSKDFKENSFYYGWHPPHPTLYVKKEVYNKYGLFNLKYPLAADFELMLRFFEKDKIKTKYIDIASVGMRLGGATSKNLSNIKRQNIEIIQAFKDNGLKPSPLYPLYRLIPKLTQYLK